MVVFDSLYTFRALFPTREKHVSVEEIRSTYLHNLNVLELFCSKKCIKEFQITTIFTSFGQTTDNFYAILS